MAEPGLRPIVVKRIKKSGGGHHGGAWKIAYADFVTAMMAFFLLMWLLGSTTKGELDGIAEYFQTPLSVALSGGPSAGNSANIIPGGGKDITQRDGEVKKSMNPAQKKTRDLKSARAELERIETARLQTLKRHIEEIIEANPVLKQFKKQLLLDITTEGLRIQIVDEQNRPMFALARADLQPYTKEILHEIGRALNDVPNKISLSGHTDAAPYLNGATGYSNWELSADRANASRRELIVGGMDEAKVLRVVGLASAVLFDRQHPTNPVNRRISIIVMNRKTEESIAKDGGAIDVASKAEVKQEIGTIPRK